MIMKMESDSGVMQLKAKEHLTPPELEEAGKSSLEHTENAALSIPLIRTCSPQNHEKIDSVVLSH
jgi:hypothetical protein